jgi:aspartate/methionine/tyrosine aminotransferase
MRRAVGSESHEYQYSFDLSDLYRLQLPVSVSFASAVVSYLDPLHRKQSSVARISMARHLTRFPRNDIMSLTEGAPRYDLAESVGPDLRLRDLVGDGDLADMPLSYGTAAGSHDLRKAIADLHDVRADDVVITLGGMHALFLTAMILCEPGDEAVTTSPLFPNTRSALASVGATVRTLPLSFGDGYRLQLDDLRAHLSPKTRLVSLASPQNPSGVVIPRQTIRDIATLMSDLCPDAFLIIDETYREAVYGDTAIAPSAISLGPKIVSCASLSKCHGAPGLRIGWAITRDAALREQLVLGKFNTVISCSPLDEALALRVLGQRDRIIGERRKHLAEGLARVAGWAEGNDALVEWVRPHAGALCCVRLKPSAFDDAAVARFYGELEQEGVRVASGTWFGDEARVFRLGFGLLDMEDLDAALARLSTALRTASQAARLTVVPAA